MSNSPPRGLLIVVEGIDGAGKSTVVKRLEKLFLKKKKPVVLSREPTNGPWGRKLRESAQTGRLSLEDELDLFIRDRREHVETLIEPALAAGKSVILDRYYFSTAAYQGARGADPEAVLQENERFAPQPDLVLLLDVAPSDGRARIRARGDQPDGFEGSDYLAQVREVFLSIERPFIRRINAGQHPDVVGRECVAEVEDVLIANNF
jgi:dTMP kinase